MAKITERIEGIRQQYHANRLRSSVKREFANDPDVEFHVSAPDAEDAPHGVNSPDEMTHSAESSRD